MRPDNAITAIVFAATAGPTAIEQAVAQVQWMVAVDTIETVLAEKLCDEVFVASNADGFISQLSQLPVVVEPDPNPFHFGRQLAEIISRRGVKRALYIGAGSTALLDRKHLIELCGRLREADKAIIPNNFWSCDFAGFAPATAIATIEPPDTDNNLAFLLNRSAGLPEIAMPRSAATQFDIDTPTDLMILSRHPGTSGAVRDYLESLSLDCTRLTAAMRHLTNDQSEVVVAGRVASAVWLHLERDTACRVRLFSEERGMRASGREARDEVRSLLGFCFERYGAKGLFEVLAELGDAAIIDSRVLFGHLGLSLSASDRFYSDLMDPDRIENEVVRALSRAALEARIPVVLGGHSVVSGGLWAMIDLAWTQHDLEHD